MDCIVTYGFPLVVFNSIACPKCLHSLKGRRTWLKMQPVHQHFRCSSYSSSAMAPLLHQLEANRSHIMNGNRDALFAGTPVFFRTVVVMGTRSSLRHPILLHVVQHDLHVGKLAHKCCISAASGRITLWLYRRPREDH